jgi:hypothetical protein
VYEMIRALVEQLDIDEVGHAEQNLSLARERMSLLAADL